MRAIRITGALLLGALIGLASDAGATSFVIPRDEVLARQAPIIAEVAVMSVSPSPAEGPPSTDYIVLVEGLLKGRVAGTSIVVRVPGGLGADGVGLKVHGAPVFREGDRLLLFLVARDDGAYAVLHLGLGAFYRLSGDVAGETRHVALRNLIGSADRAEEGGLIDAPRDWASFSAWLADLSAGKRSAADYFLSAEDVEFLPLPVGVEPMPVAWERFTQGRRVRWRSPALARQWLRRALAGWSDAARTSVRLRPSMADGEGAGLRRPDGANELILSDRDNLIAGSFSCRRGGIAALSATWFDPAVTFRFRSGSGGVAIRAKEADIVLNDGAECLLRKAGEGLALAVLSHELGHTLGLEHSGEPDSPMFPVVLDRSELGLESLAEWSRLEFLYPARAATEPRSGVGESREN